MRVARILDWLERVVLTLGVQGLDRSRVLRPNSPRDLADAPVYFELGLDRVERRVETERSARASAVAIVVVSCAPRDGVERLDALVRALIVALVATRNRAAPLPSDAAARVYVDGVRVSGGEFQNGRHKATVWIDLDIYEED